MPRPPTPRLQLPGTFCASPWASRPSTTSSPISRQRSPGSTRTPAHSVVLELIDLDFLGYPRAIGVYLLDTPEGPALFDCGPSTTLPALKAGLRRHGLELTDVRHLLLSHIHLDHAGAAGPIVREHPELTVWVSEIGAPHLVDPSRLESSARRLYGESFDHLWGELSPVPESNVALAAGDVLGWEAFPTPGHASHHVSYFKDGVLLAGDACGVRL